MLLNSHGKRLTGACAAAILVVALAGCGGGDASSPAGAQATDESKLRTVLVFDHEPAPSPSPGSLRAGLEQGHLPDGAAKATVLTDEDCAPDRWGISHCRNLVRLASGRIVALRHPHDMNRVPCLAPGERVLLRRA